MTNWEYYLGTPERIRVEGRGCAVEDMPEGWDGE